MNRKIFAQYGMIAAILMGGLVLFIQKFSAIESVVGTFFAMLTPFYIGFGIAYVINPILKHLETRFKIKRGIAIAGTYIVLLVVIGFAAWWLIPQSITNALAIIGNVTDSLSTLQQYATNMKSTALGKYLNVDFNTMAGQVANVANLMLQNLSNILLNLTAAFFNTFLGIIISIYMAISKGSAQQQISKLLRRFFPEGTAQEIEHFGHEANEIFSSFLTGLILDAMIFGVLAFAGFTILRVQYAPTLALVISVTNLIPYFGPLIGAIPVFVSTVVYDPMKAVWVMVFILVLREVDANYIGPRIMKSRVGLTPLWIIFFIIIFGGFFGAAGIILAIPTGAFLKVLIQHLFHSTLLPSPVFQKKGNGLSSIESDATMHSPIHSKEE